MNRTPQNASRSDFFPLMASWGRPLLALVLVGMTAPCLVFARSDVETKVVSHVYNGYTRARLADGSYQPETYAFANGGFFDGETIAGDSVNSITFKEVARTVAAALRGQNYFSSAEPQTTGQFIMLWYGTTRRTADKPVAYDLIEQQNSRILGFQRERARANDLYFTSMARDFQDEFTVSRYFVVLKAYDFQVAQKEKRLKLLWESRFSIQRQAVSFDEELPAMAAFAARTFGQETNGIFDADSIKGTVKMDEVKVLGTTDR